MSMRPIEYSLSLLFALSVGSAGIARAQCLEFAPGFGPPGGGLSGGPFGQVVFDDGTGPALYMAGSFQSAGDVVARNVAKWDGTSWSALGSGLDGPAYSIAAFDDGTGPALYVGGTFSHAGGITANNIAKWDGTSWSALGSGVDGWWVNALVAFDDGSGPALYAAGRLDHAGGIPIFNIGRWDGSSWSSVGSGATLPELHALLVHDDGSGAKLYAGGDPGVLRWDGTSWSEFGGGVNGFVHSMTTFNDGSGAALYVGGRLTTAGGLSVGGIAEWDGQAWSTLSGGVGFSNNDLPDVMALGVYDAGGGPRLYVGGMFISAGGAPAHDLATWNGSTWSAIDGVISIGVQSFEVFDSGGGPILYVGASVGIPGSVPVMGVARWDGTNWHDMQSGSYQGLYGTVYALATYDDGNGRAVYAGGQISAAGTVFTGGVVKWNGTNWSALGGGVQGIIYAMTEFDDGTGPALYAAGEITSASGVATGNVVRWDGLTWSSVGPVYSLTYPEVDALCVFNDGHGPRLYAGGHFAEGIVVWDATQGWQFLPGGGVDEAVESMTVHDDGSGPALFVGGKFTTPAQDIAKWNGSSWAALGCGIGTPHYNDHVWALTSFDFGAGPELVAGGNFHRAGCAPSSNVVRWNGTTWSSTNAADGNVRSLIRFDDGAGPALYAGRAFPGGVIKRTGSSWSALGGSLGGFARALATFDNASSGGTDLIIGSGIITAGEVSVGIATWRGCSGPGTKFCFGDGSASTCPCANNGAFRHGCENSYGTGGAELSAAGGIHPDTVVLTSTGELSHALSIFLQGSASVGPFHYGDGLRCSGGTLRRLFIKSASGGFASAPQSGDSSITARSAALGDPIAAGSTRYYQTYYRDPNGSYCPNPPGNTWNITNGVRITW